MDELCCDVFYNNMKVYVIIFWIRLKVFINRIVNVIIFFFFNIICYIIFIYKCYVVLVYLLVWDGLIYKIYKKNILCMFGSCIR